MLDRKSKMIFSKRIFDITAAAVLIILFSPLFAVVAISIFATSPGAVVYRSKRIGRANQPFFMHKFRTMKRNTPQVATHLLANADAYLTPIGSFLQKTSLDELPQLLDVLMGTMSLVGPRPALYNQYDLVAMRTERGIDSLTPGITGWAQINGRDELPIPQKVELDFYYLCHRSILFDLQIVVLTVAQVLRRDGVKH